MTFLQANLQGWDVGTTDHVGVEVLIPTHLKLLTEEKLNFTFLGEGLLQKLNAPELANLKPEIVYSMHTTTLLNHLMEAFAALLDFGKIKHHLVDEDLMGPPSSSAAYIFIRMEC